jgi:hypothetical protein
MGRGNPSEAFLISDTLPWHVPGAVLQNKFRITGQAVVRL